MDQDQHEPDVTPGANKLSWVEILNANPRAKEGQFNTDRKKLLCVGAHIFLSPMTAESWISELRIRRRTIEEVARTRGEPIPESSKQGVRVTIVEIPEATKADPVDGKIVVEADGIRAEIYASVFYNCIKGPETTPIGFTSADGVTGIQWRDNSEGSGVG